MRVRIEQDTDAMNPRTEDDNLGTMVCFHGRYTLGDKGHGYKRKDYSGWEELKEAITRKENVVVILPLYLYDHGGISIQTTPFSSRWDSGQVGFIFVSKDVAKKEYSWWDETWNRVTDNHPARIIEKVLRDEVETYNQYLNGNVWGYVIEDDDGNKIDSCWGFYGREYCEEEARNVMAIIKAEKNDQTRMAETKS